MQSGANSPATTTIASVPDGTLRIWLLGGMRVTCGKHEIADVDWRLTKARNIVKLLAIAPGHQLHREYLMDLLWPDLSAGSADNNFHQALHSARRALATVLDEQPGGPPIRLRQGIVTFNPDIRFWVDVDEFTALAQAAIDSGDPSLYNAAIDIYRGELLPEDRYEEWSAPRRASLQQTFIDLLQKLGQIHEARRESTPAIDVYRRIVELDPISEDAHVGLIRLYALTGRRQQALRQYERLCDELAAELDTEPEPASHRLYLDILDNRYPATPMSEPVVVVPRQPPVARVDRMVDRVLEMQQLLTFLDRAVSGAGQIVAVGGEPGIGKTRLAEEFAVHAKQRGALVLWGRCYEGDTTPAFWPWSQIIGSWVRAHDNSEVAHAMSVGAPDIARILPELRQRIPHLPDPLPVGAEAERFRLYSSVTEFLRNAALIQPLAIILDDLHWADRSSILLLEFAINELADSAIIGIGTYRNIDVQRGHPLQQVLARLNRFQDDRRISMAGFTPDDVAEMAEVTSGRVPLTALAEAIHEQTNGNPFFVREIVRLMVDEGRYDQHENPLSWKVTVPRSVRETIGLRLDRLSDDALRLLTIAAVTGREFELATVARAADVTIDRAIDMFDEGRSAAIVNERDDQPGRMHFAHALTRLTLYEDVSLARRIRLHRQVGKAIEEIHAADLSPWLADLAGHFVACSVDGDSEKGIRYSIEAGRQSMRLVAYGEAVKHFRQAAELVELNDEPSNERYVEILLILADALRCDGETRDARTTYIRTASIASDAGYAEVLARAALGMANTEGEAEVDDAATINLLELALELLPDTADVLRASTLACLSTVLHYHDPASLPRRRELARQAVALARRIDDPATLATALHAQLQADVEPLDIMTNLNLVDEILRLAIEAGDGSLALTLRSRRFAHLMELGDIVAADRELEAYAALAKDLRLPYNLWAVTFKQAMRALMAGHFDEGERLALDAYRFGERSAPLSAHPLYVVQQFVLFRERGGLASLEEDLRRYANDNLPSFRFERCLLGIIYAETGRDDEARAEVRTVTGDRIEDIPTDIFWIGVMALLADICVHLGDTERCRKLYDLLVPFSGRLANSGTGVISIGPVSYYLGILARTLGDLSNAVQHLEDAIDFSLRIHAPVFVAYARYALATTLAIRNSDGDPERVSGLLDECRRTADELGMPRLRTHVDNSSLRED